MVEARTVARPHAVHASLGDIAVTTTGVDAVDARVRRDRFVAASVAPVSVGAI
jgi:hypothetical protein